MITVVKLPPAPVKERKRTPVESTTLNRVVEKGTGRVVYLIKRTSPKKTPQEPDYYVIPVDEDKCSALSCLCYDYVKHRQPVGEQCKHQLAVEERLRERQRQRWQQFSAAVSSAE